MLRRIGRWVIVAALLGASVGASVWAYRLAGVAWNGVVEYRSPYLEDDRQASAAGEASVDRVVLVIVDGLRLDASRRMSSLEALRGYGADLALEAPQPSLSYPNWTTILTGTTQDVHGVVTNWHDGAAGAESFFDVAREADVPFVVVGPSDIATLYPSARVGEESFFLDWSKEYLSDRYVTEALDLVERHDPRLVVIHLPDIDEAGHASGGASEVYAQTVARVDADIRRLVEGLQDTRTTFCVVSDHGHIDTGGHGGWEPEVVEVPGIIAGPGVRAERGEASLVDLAPTLAVLSGTGVPRHATGRVLESVLTSTSAEALSAAREQRSEAVRVAEEVLLAPVNGQVVTTRSAEVADDELDARLASARRARLAFDRAERSSGLALWIAAAVVVFITLAALGSWRALAAAGVGAVAYHAVYNSLFFLLHGNHWSLSAFNSEDNIDAWMNTRLIEAAIAGLVAVAVAAWVYPYLRRAPKGPRGTYLPGWLSLGPLVVLTTQATLALMVAWFVWAWGVEPVWGMPDLMWGFKFDLDLIQATALGGAAVLAPVVSYLVGRYHPRIRGTGRPAAGDSAGEDLPSAAPPSAARPARSDQ